MSNDRFKFRVWDKKDKKYLDPDYYERFYMLPDGVVDVVMTVKHALYDECQVIPPQQLIVERCTGLRDRYNKLIYEGDILRLSFYDRKVDREIYYDQGCCQYFLRHLDKRMFDGYTFNSSVANNLEVVGNIHEMEVCQ